MHWLNSAANSRPLWLVVDAKPHVDFSFLRSEQFVFFLAGCPTWLLVFACPFCNTLNLNYFNMNKLYFQFIPHLWTKKYDWGMTFELSNIFGESRGEHSSCARIHWRFIWWTFNIFSCMRAQHIVHAIFGLHTWVWSTVDILLFCVSVHKRQAVFLWVRVTQRTKQAKEDTNCAACVCYPRSLALLCYACIHSHIHTS